MNENQDIRNMAFYYSVNMLRILLHMGLITEDEYNRIVQLSAAHYHAENIFI